MTTAATWQDFLQAQSFPAIQTQLEAAANGTVLTNLSTRGLLKLSGDDAVTFLQGQVTNDVKALNGNNSHFSGYCSAKGRLLALFFAYAVDNAIYLRLDRTVTESVLKRLKMYVLRSKVTITDESHIIKLGIAGKNAEAVLAKLFPNVPSQAHALERHENSLIIRLPSPTPMFEMMTNDTQALALAAQLAPTTTLIEQEAWQWLEIQAGLPDITASTQEAFVPQMLNLDALGGINFKKGCYTGQEIVARTHYLGSVKRRTQLAHIATDAAPQIGDAIIGADQQTVGQIVLVSPALNHGFDVLAECRLENIEQGKVFWQTHALEIKPLPYAL